MTEDHKKQIETLVKKATEAPQGHDALHFSQAALNAANAFAQVHNTK
jgi:hypothetical protein